ncbi:hypothetical protein [Actinocatenispora comari]|uniref:Uncharacterized protein n=1 Tax=Actinocatenispora comari TaxID=2807577 RepID=A0A8J4A843_9ACTN|nr:hypothetical protein [Actinocatenispora comari]GIL25980.1 hypothetical protein NUM_12340 [Actinocatenispora comari]
MSEPNDWWKRAERRVVRANRRRRLGRALLAPFRFVLAPRSPATVAVTVLLAVAVVLAGGYLWRHPDRLTDRFAADHSSAPAPVTDPFVGTPAYDYPSGAAGITLPTPHAVGGYSAATVRTALTAVRTVLVRGHLERRMLVDHDDSALLAALARDSRRRGQELVHDGVFGLRVADDAELTGQQPRVKGSLTVSVTHQRTTTYLTITSNVVWAYAFRHASDPVVVHDKLVFWYVTGDHLAAESRGVWIRDSQAYLYAMDCAASDHGLLKPGPDIDPSAKPGGGAGDGTAMYDPKHALAVSNDCR